MKLIVTKLCDFCRRLDVLSGITSLDSSEDSSTLLGLESPWHVNLKAIKESATSCVLCELVMQGWRNCRESIIDSNRKEGWIDDENPPEDLLFDITEINAYQSSELGAVTLHVGRQKRKVADGRQSHDYVYFRATCKLLGPRTSGDCHDDLVANFRVSQDPDVLLPYEIQRGSVMNESHPLTKRLDDVVATDPLCTRSLETAKFWLKTCVKTHGERCRPSYIPENPSWQHMPTRVLEVTPDGAHIFLRITQNTKPVDGRYVALSHCWGSSGSYFTTTKATLLRRLDGIDFKELPQTFRDAVTITRSLGLKYLWIDSLCILQQDDEDWQIESAKMANVYHDAYLVLGAAAGSSDDLGFLGPRTLKDSVHLPSTPQFTFCLQLLPPKGHRWTSNQGHGPDLLASEPLTLRAWCLQERYLALRSLQYGSHQMFWECELVKASEDGDIIAQTGSYLKSLCRTGLIEESVFHRKQRNPFEEDQNVKWVHWYRMVEDYTSRIITNKTDKLPAVSGLANAIARTTGQDEYLAGLWKTGLLEGLIWQRAKPNQVFNKVDEYIAPSWSWASVQGPVQFPIYNWHFTRASWVARMPDFEPLASYVSHSTKLKDIDLYGRLEHESLCITASLLPVVSIQPRPLTAPRLENLYGQEPFWSSIANKTIEIQLSKGKIIWIDGGFDSPDDKGCLDLNVIFLTRLPRIVHGGFMEHRFGLLVQRLENGDYRRVGFVDGLILKARRSAISRLKKIMSELSRQQDKQSNEEQFEIFGYQGFKDGDLDEAEPPNLLAQNPIAFEAINIALV